MVTLTGEQKTIEALYCTTSERYVVPMYQRPYSWGEEQWSELLRDLIDACESEEPYFLGILILARDQNFNITGENHIVDGQQRIITLWILIKVLSLITPNVNSLKAALSVMPWEGEGDTPKIKSLVFENDDEESLKTVFELSSLDSLDNKNDKKNKEDKSQICKCFQYFRENIGNYISNQGLRHLNKFSMFLMRQVTLLPIVQAGVDVKDAERRALSIFETINNRGLDLEDADIFKARLYDSAQTQYEKRDFIDQWNRLKKDCDSIGVTIDDLFRYYSHVIRGREGISGPERKLRDFYLDNSASPILYSTYIEVLDDLSQILNILKYIKKEAQHDPIIGPWINILNEYSNQYPIYAVVVFAYFNGYRTESELTRISKFLKSLVRYVLYMGSTTKVKFEIYTMIRRIAKGEPIDSYRRDNVSHTDFDNLGRLRNAFALLAYVLTYGQNVPAGYSVDKIINIRDEEFLGQDWIGEDIKPVSNSIGNLLVMDIPRKNIYLDRKYDYYATSSLDSVRTLLDSSTFSFEQWHKRNETLKQTLTSFFKK